MNKERMKHSYCDFCKERGHNPITQECSRLRGYAQIKKQEQWSKADMNRKKNQMYFDDSDDDKYQVQERLKIQAYIRKNQFLFQVSDCLNAISPALLDLIQKYAREPHPDTRRDLIHSSSDLFQNFDFDLLVDEAQKTIEFREDPNNMESS